MKFIKKNKAALLFYLVVIIASLVLIQDVKKNDCQTLENGQSYYTK